ncbi:hypothetical protein ACWGQ4_28610 [Streptomyces sp. NPDC055721]|uniref:hypothetical protein n=1 Tax=Streptomyces sp. NPDC127132 TaxID=3345374 RepID=UPI0036294499
MAIIYPMILRPAARRAAGRGVKKPGRWQEPFAGPSPKGNTAVFEYETESGLATITNADVTFSLQGDYRQNWTALNQFIRDRGT